MVCFISPLSFLAFDLLLVLAFHQLLQVHPQSDLSERLQFYQALLLVLGVTSLRAVAQTPDLKI